VVGLAAWISSEFQSGAPMTVTMTSSDDEQGVLENVLRTMVQYEEYASHALLTRRKKDFKLLSAAQSSLLNPIVQNQFTNLQNAIAKNTLFWNAVTSSFHPPNLSDTSFCQNEFESLRRRHPVPSVDIEKAISTLKQVARDWSAVGRKEREETYTPMIRALENEFPSQEDR
jgi:carnosine N-methyltransferase